MHIFFCYFSGWSWLQMMWKSRSTSWLKRVSHHLKLVNTSLFFKNEGFVVRLLITSRSWRELTPWSHDHKKTEFPASFSVDWFAWHNYVVCLLYKWFYYETLKVGLKPDVKAKKAYSQGLFEWVSAVSALFQCLPSYSHACEMFFFVSIHCPCPELQKFVKSLRV